MLPLMPLLKITKPNSCFPLLSPPPAHPLHIIVWGLFWVQFIATWMYLLLGLTKAEYTVY